MMNKTAALILAASVGLLAGCAASQQEKPAVTADTPEAAAETALTMEDVTLKNRLSSILAVKKSATQEYSSDYTYSGTSYIEQGLMYGEYPDYSFLKLGDTYYFYIPDDDGTLLLYEEFNAMREEEAKALETIPEDYFSIDPSETGNETITEIKRNDDGTIDLYTEGNSQVAEEFLQEFYPDYDSVKEYRETPHYKIDAETLLLLEGEEIIVIDGEPVTFSHIEITYDSELTELGKQMREAVNESIEAKNGPCITFTAIYDPGTETEETFSITVGEGHHVDLKLREGYKAYFDKERTKPCEDRMLRGGSEDVTLYVFAEQQ